MILELYMKNCALVEELRLGIDENLNILTGETGSGKSIIIDALGLCLGEKYDRSFLRKGTEKGVIEAVFHSESSNLKKVLHEHDLDLDEDNLLVITRVIYSDGKSVARVNGRTVKLSVLKDIGAHHIPMIYVYNKIDLLPQLPIFEQENSIGISVKENLYFNELEDMIIHTLFKDYELIELYIPYDHGEIFQQIQQTYEFIKEEYLETGIYISFFIDMKQKHKYQQYIYHPLN